MPRTEPRSWNGTASNCMTGAPSVEQEAVLPRQVARSTTRAVIFIVSESLAGRPTMTGTQPSVRRGFLGLRVMRGAFVFCRVPVLRMVVVMGVGTGFLVGLPFAGTGKQGKSESGQQSETGRHRSGEGIGGWM